MRNTLKRVLDRLRGLTGGANRKRTTVRDGLQEPQHMAALPAPIRVRT